MVTSKSIGHQLVEARKRMLWSQAELASQLSISPQAVGKWERGESLPDITMLVKMAEIFELELNYFVDGLSTIQHVHSSEESINETPSNVVRDDELVTPSHEWDMSKSNWQDADFSGLKNVSNHFSGSNSKNCLFRTADFKGITLAKNNIELCDFTDSDLSFCSIQHSNLNINQFVNVTFEGTDFFKCNVEKCNFERANFSSATFREVHFGKNTVTNSILTNTRFYKSAFDSIVFSGKIENCHFEQCGFYQVKFENAIILATFFKDNARFKKVTFENCQVDQLTYAFLKNNNANLTGISLLI